MADKIAELKADMAELELLATQATRQKVKDVLTVERRRLITEIIKLEEAQKVAETASGIQHVQPVKTKSHYQVKLNNYAWDQTGKFVKFYVTLPKVHTLTPENVHCNFTHRSLELNVFNLDDKDYVFTINNLLKPIDPEKSSWRLKTDTVIINAAKTADISWSHVTELEKRASDAKKILPESEKSDDPSDGLMSIMRTMYMQGDDEMKRTIAKAFTESQQKTFPQP